MSMAVHRGDSEKERVWLPLIWVLAGAQQFAFPKLEKTMEVFSEQSSCFARKTLTLSLLFCVCIFVMFVRAFGSSCLQENTCGAFELRFVFAFFVNLREYRAAECAGVGVCVCTLSVCCVCVFCSACGVCQYVRGPGCMGVVFGVCLCQVRACVRVWSGVLLVLVLYSEASFSPNIHVIFLLLSFVSMIKTSAGPKKTKT